ncbi:hypothetical protein DQE80_15740, partial [Enterococcus sp. HPCN18]
LSSARHGGLAPSCPQSPVHIGQGRRKYESPKSITARVQVVRAHEKRRPAFADLPFCNQPWLSVAYWPAPGP